ncbi:putative ADP-ribosylation factor GTPase-activating protein AGD6 [Cocos nucifera]|nr:putative ADP-ribosylation factor GTPase-activating protein AGD6 [Cocos nucifera]
MCLECFGKHCGLGIHISFICFVTIDSRFKIQLKKIEADGNDHLNSFLAQYDILKEIDIPTKYNTNTAVVYCNRIQALAEGRPWWDTPVVKETLMTIGGYGTREIKKSPL